MSAICAQETKISFCLTKELIFLSSSRYLVDHKYLISGRYWTRDFRIHAKYFTTSATWARHPLLHALNIASDDKEI